METLWNEWGKTDQKIRIAKNEKMGRLRAETLGIKGDRMNYSVNYRDLGNKI
ncbi:hypothetical protein [Oculatella sp. LEGE 06141]|uniref:hypothetical protein n=1 Tax=Oculatella sp. LEGE 06141 TaxID=1828648 RepID=UPI00188224D5|nr:hypothetical protein [Oculatella sp. LEGE 06141]